MKEKREYIRVPAIGKVKYRLIDLAPQDTRAEEVISKLINISTDGVMFETKGVIDAETPLELEINIDRIPKPIIVQGKVTWSGIFADSGEKFGTGVKFTNIPDESLALLNQYINEKNKILSRIQFLRKYPKEDYEEREYSIIGSIGWLLTFIIILGAVIYFSTKPRNPNEQFSNAKTLLFNKRFDETIEEFRKFVKNSPNSDLCDNALYYIGYAFMHKEDYKHAVSEFQKLLDKYPQTEKRIDTLFYLGSNYMFQKKNTKAKKIFQQVIREYPGTKRSEEASTFIRLMEHAEKKSSK